MELKATTKLEKAVKHILEAKACDGYPMESVIKDLFYGGCQSGMIGELIYYHDTVEFYKRHAKEIDAMLRDLCNDCGCFPSQLFGDKWDNDDPLARDIYNQNLLAWFGFEETARRMAESAGMEV